MVNIRTKLILLGVVALVLAMFAMNVAYAARSKLVISDVDVRIGSKTLKNLSDGSSVSEEARPGRTVEVRVETRNDFTRTEDIKIDGITTKVKIENIDNGDDLEQESRDYDLRADSETKFNFKFEIPLEVREDTYNIVITSEGNDVNGTRNLAEVRLKLDVNKQNHDILILQKSLTPNEVSCKRKNIQLSTTLLNIGNDDEDKVTFQILNSQLGINVEDTFGGLRALPNEPESRFSKIYSFDVPNDAEPGSYPLTLRATYDNDRKVTEDEVTLVVDKCTAPQATTAKPREQTGYVEGGVELITSGQTTPAVQPTPPGAIITQESLLSSPLFVVGVLAAEVIAVIIGIVLVVTLFKRKG